MERDAIDAAWRGLRQASGTPASPELLESAIAVGLLQNAAGAAASLRASTDEGAAAVAQKHAVALAERGWTGDAELIAQLDGSVAGLRRLTVELDAVGDALADERGGYLDLTDGMVWPTSVLEDGDVDDIDPEEEPDRFLFVDGWGRRDGWSDLVDFAEGLDDATAREALLAAVQGKGAFRRFQAALDRHGRHRAAWRVFSSERRSGRARAWLLEQGIEPLL
jgi:hypothetical protein